MIKRVVIALALEVSVANVVRIHRWNSATGRNVAVTFCINSILLAAIQ